MTASLNQKLLASIIVLTLLYSTLIFFVYYDMMRNLSRSVAHLIPGILLFCFGIAANIFFKNPALIFDQLLPIKSGFAKGIIGTTIFPFIGASIRALTVIGGLSLLIDKVWFYWRLHRITFFIRMLSVVGMIVLTGSILFNFIYIDLKEIPNETIKLNVIGAWSGTALGTFLLLVTLLAIPHIFSNKQPSEPQ